MATAEDAVTTANYKHIEVHPVAGNIGAEISGIDMRKPLAEEAVAEIRSAWLQHLVLFFRDQDITPEQHKDFARNFGELHIHPYIPTLEGHPEIIELKSETTGPAQMSYQSNKWHTDLTFMAEPAAASLLWSQQAPDAGGDTMFMNLYRAYETLSAPMREFLDGLTATHDITASMPADFMLQSWAPAQLERFHKATPPVSHPVVRTHPETGRKCLFVNSNFTSHINELSRNESDALLDCLYEHMAKPENVVRFNWRSHSMAFWDNRCTQHYAVNDYYALRVMYRVTLCGDKPF